MQAEAITYQSGPRKSDKRTVLVTGAHESVVLVPGGERLVILTANLLRGKTDRCSWWADQLGTPDDDTFAVPVDAVFQMRDIGPVEIKRSCK